MKKAGSSISVIALVAAAFFMENLDGTVIATALPQMARSFHVGAVRMNVGMTAYLLTLAIFIPVSGWIADRIGDRTVFASAVAVFTTASLLCGFSRTFAVFTVMRVLQGIGGAMMVPVGRLIVLRTTPKARLTQTIMYIQWPGLIALVLGPAVGGFITTYASWQWIFFLNVPLGAVALVLSLRWIANTRADRTCSFDWLVFVLGGAASTGLVYGMEQSGAPESHWGNITAIFVLSAVCALCAVLAARRNPQTSFIDMVSLRNATYAQAIYGASAFRIAVSVLPFLLPLMFQLSFGLTPFRSGLYLLALFAGDMSMKAFVVPILRRWGFRQVMIGNGLMTAGTLALCALLNPWTPLGVLVAVLFVHGACRSLEFTCTGTLAFADVDPKRMSRANAFQSTIVQLGMGLGVPFGAVCLRATARLGHDSIAAPALRDFHWSILLAALLALGPVINGLALPEHAGADVSGHGGRAHEIAADPEIKQIT